MKNDFFLGLKRKMNISRSQRTYIITQAIIGLFINVVLNAAVGYYSFDMTAMLSVKSLSFDFFMTNFMLLFMTSMILSRATQKEITEKKLTAIYTLGLVAFSTKYSPRQFLNGLVLALSASLIFAPTFLVILNAIFDGNLSAVTYVSFKAIYSGILALFFSPCVMILAMAEYATLKTVNSYQT